MADEQILRKLVIEGLEKTRKELEDLRKEMGMVDETTKELNDELEDTAEEMDDVADETAKTTKAMKTLPGPLGAVQQGIKGVVTGFKALLANPVVLVIVGLVAAIGALFKAFQSTKEGGEKVSQVLAGLSAIMDVLRDVAVTVGKTLFNVFTQPKEAVKSLWEFIKSNLIARFEGLIDSARAVGKILKSAFELDFDGVKEGAKEFGEALVQVGTGFTPEEIVQGFNDIKDAVVGVATEIKNEAILAAQLTATLQKLTDEERNLKVLRAEQNKELAQAKLLIEDTNASFEIRLSAIDAVLEAEQKLLGAELENKRARLEAAEALASLSDSDAQTLDEIAQLQIEIANLEQTSFNARKTIEKRKQGLIKESFAVEEEYRMLSEERQIEMIENEQERENAKLELAKEREIEAIEKSLLLEEEKARRIAEIEEFYGFQSLQLQKTFAKEKEKVDKASAATKIKLEEGTAKANIAVTQTALGVVTDAVGESSAIGKAAAVASATISTFEGANKALGQGGFFGFIGAAAVIVAGLLNVRKILSTQIPSKKTVPTPSISASTAQGPNFQETISSAQINTRPIAEIDPNAPPMKAYVVSEEMTTQQQLDKRIETQSGF